MRKNCDASLFLFLLEVLTTCWLGLAEGRKQKAEDRRQKTEKKTADRKQKRRQKTGNRSGVNSLILCLSLFHCLVLFSSSHKASLLLSSGDVSLVSTRSTTNSPRFHPILTQTSHLIITETAKMAEADTELQQVISTLKNTYLRLSVTGGVLPQKPSGQEYAQLHRDMHHFLVLKEIVKEGENVSSIDLWDLFLNEFGHQPAPSRHRRRPASPYPGACFLSPVPIPPIQAAASATASTEAHANNAGDGRNEQQTASVASAFLAGRRVRFQTPLPLPRRMN